MLTCTPLLTEGPSARTLLRIAGEEAGSFLNALVSNDVSALPPGRATYAALLTPQGKFLHDMLVVGQEKALLLDVAAAGAADLRKRLMLYRLRAKIEIAELDWQGFALFGEGAEPAMAGDGVLFRDPRHPALGWRLWLPADATPDLAIAEPELYERHRLALGVPDGARDIETGKGLLLENHFEDLHGVDFRKGCYIGQELTARTKYRGLVKKQLHIVTAAPGSVLPPAGTIITLDGQEAGEMRSSFEHAGLALLRLDVVAKAMQSGAPLDCEGVALTPRRPDYASPAPAKD